MGKGMVENFKEIRARMFENILISAIVHFVFAFMVVLGMFNILSSGLFFTECPANSVLPIIAICIGFMGLLDVVFAIVSIAPFSSAFAFTFLCIFIRLLNTGTCIYYILEIVKLNKDPDRFLFCDPNFVNITMYNACIFVGIVIMYFVVIFINLITAIFMG